MALILDLFQGENQNNDYKIYKDNLEKSKNIIDLKERVLFLKEQKKIFKQNSKWDLNNIAQGYQLEIEYVEHLIKSQQTENTNNSIFKLSGNNLTQIDIIRIADALYRMNGIIKVNEDKPTKEEFMEAFGSLFNIDMENYSSKLSHSLKHQPIEANLETFEKLKRKIQDAHYEGEKK